MIHIEEEEKLSNEINIEKIAMDALEATRKFVGCEFPCDVELLLVDEKNIKEINLITRNINAPTDVLSFPYTKWEKPKESPEFDDLDFEPETGELLLGQIVVCSTICKKQAIEYGHSLAREFAFLITHSFLHLFGYDHMKEEEEEEMCKAQEKILSDIGITRDAK